MRRQREWLTNTHGLCSKTNLLMIKTCKTVLHLCNSSQKFFQTKKPTNSSMKMWCFSQPRSFRVPSKKLTYQNLRKKSAVCSDQMPSILLRESSLTNRGKTNTTNWEMPLQKRLASKWSKEWKWDLECPRKTTDNLTLERRLRSDHYSPDSLLMELCRLDHLWSLWFSHPWKIRLRFSRKKVRKRMNRKTKIRCTSREASSKRSLNRRPKGETPLT
jgi:hypothetical protein